MSSSSARIEVHAGELAGSIIESLSGEGGYGMTMAREGDKVIIDLDEQALPHLRAAINSVLRLVQAGHGALDASGTPRG